MQDTLVPTSSNPVATLLFFLVVFGVVGVVFLFIHLLMGSVIRPKIPDKEKLTIYECGEPTVGSAWIQFDLRFYVVALLFVIFDVEVAFFFPWAVVFGKVNQLANLPPSEQRPAEKLTEEEKERSAVIEKERMQLSEQLLPSGVSNDTKRKLKLATYAPHTNEKGQFKETEHVIAIEPTEAARWAKIAFVDIMVFFGVLLVGFAYLWRRGDINWVRAFAPHQEPPTPAEKPMEQQKIGA
jgi:NADH-quinone oxidoreductase subunit A